MMLNNYYDTKQASIILGLSEEKIIILCEESKFSEAINEDDKWYIPKKCFKVTLEQAIHSNSFMEHLDKKISNC